MTCTERGCLRGGGLSIHGSVLFFLIRGTRGNKVTVLPHNTNPFTTVIPNLIRNLIIERTCEEGHTLPLYNRPFTTVIPNLIWNLILSQGLLPRWMTKHGAPPCCPHVSNIQRMLAKFRMRFRVGARNDSNIWLLLCSSVCPYPRFCFIMRFRVVAQNDRGMKAMRMGVRCNF